MSHEVPPSIAEYLEGSNTRDFARAAAAFADDAVVHDESRDHVGREAIAAWVRDTVERYAMHLVVERVAGATATVRVTGTFPGSPISLRYAYRIVDGRIARLEIGS